MVRARQAERAIDEGDRALCLINFPAAAFFHRKSSGNQPRALGALMLVSTIDSCKFGEENSAWSVKTNMKQGAIICDPLTGPAI